ncbi:MAG: fluoride efflux transporter CrcB [Pseudomonadota bacterium]
MKTLLLVGLGGSVGAVLRYGTSTLVQRFASHGFPLGTLFVNLVGCLIIGALMALVQSRAGLSTELRLLLVVGLLGSFTTFSTFGHETLTLMQSEQHGLALLNVLASVVVGVLAVWVGHLSLRALIS